MLDLLESLLACGYTGPCKNLGILKWALRVGACSEFFNDLIYWLEVQLRLVISNQEANDSIRHIFCMLRRSMLMNSSYGSNMAANPREFRLKILKVLMRQLQLRKLPERMHGNNLEQSDRGNVKKFGHFTITINNNETPTREIYFNG